MRIKGSELKRIIREEISRSGRRGHLFESNEDPGFEAEKEKIGRVLNSLGPAFGAACDSIDRNLRFGEQYRIILSFGIRPDGSVDPMSAKCDFENISSKLDSVPAADIQSAKDKCLQIIKKQNFGPSTYDRSDVMKTFINQNQENLGSMLSGR